MGLVTRPASSEPRRRAARERGVRSSADTAVFLAAFFAYVGLAVEPRLILHSIGIFTYYHPFAFRPGWDFLREHLARPGGLAEYAMRLFTPLYAFDWLGAAIVTAIAWLTCLAADDMARLAGRPRGRVLRFAPAIALAAMLGGYHHPLATPLALLASVAPQGTVWRALLLGIAGGLLYQAVGSASLLFTVLALTHETLIRRQAVPAIAAAGLGAVVPLAAARLYDLDIGAAYVGFLWSDPGVPPDRWPMVPAIHLFFPALLVGNVVAQAVALRRSSPRIGRRERGKRKGRGELPLERSLPVFGAAWAAAQTGLVLAVGGVVAWLTLDTVSRTVLEVDYYAERRQWAAALQAARSMPKGFYHVRSHRNIVLALSHTGRLGDDLFQYPQRPGVDLFSTPLEVRDGGTFFQEGRLFLELGQVNQAEKCFCEALEVCGDLPVVLEELAMINVVKGRPEGAGIYWSALRQRHPLHRPAAEAMLRQVVADPAMQGDARVSAIRRNMLEADFVAPDTSIEGFLVPLLEKNPRNRLALELLLTHYLQVQRPDLVAACLGRQSELPYRVLPRHYQEAIVIHGRMSGRQPRLAGYDLDPAILRQADEFARILSTAKGPTEAAAAAREAGFGDSYFYYFAFGESGK